jgi:hypothetical protein
MLLVSRVTAPVRARARPEREAPVVIVMLAIAITLPAKLVLVPKVAELPICQNTLQGFTLPVMRTDESLAVVRVVPI